MSEKIYAGKGKKKSDSWLQVTVNPEVINKHIQTYEGKQYVKLNINIGKPDKYGKDVQITIDDWKPEKANQEKKEDLPF